MRFIVICVAVIGLTWGQCAADDAIQFKAPENAVAFDTIATHSDLWVAAAMYKDDNGLKFHTLQMQYAAFGKIMDVPAGTMITVVGRSNGHVVESKLPGHDRIWLIPVKLMNKAGLPSPKIDLTFE